jgi:ketosteroid isomerase-like protein
MLLIAKCFLLISLLSSGLAQKPARETRASRDVKELSRLEAVWNEAHLRGDAIALNNLWDNDLFVTVPDMPVMNKEESLAIWKSGKMKFDIYRTSDVRIRVYGDSAVVTGQLERIRDSTSQKFEDDWRFTKVYVRRAGRWQVVAWHGSHVGSSG